MSALNSSPSELREELMPLLFEEPSITFKDLLYTGLDLDLLDKTVQAIVPRLNYLRGYQDLGSFFLANEYEGTEVPYKKWFLQHTVPKHIDYGYNIPLLDANMKERAMSRSGWVKADEFDPDAFPQNHAEYRRVHRAQLRVWLTRRREWIVWASYPTSRFMTARTVPEMLGIVDDLTPKRYYLEAESRFIIEIPSIAYAIYGNLLKFVAASNKKKRDDLDKEEALFANLEKTHSKIEEPH